MVLALCNNDLQIANNILSIIVSALSIIVIVGGWLVYQKYIREHINIKKIDSYYSFYCILSRQLKWLKMSLEKNGNYALGKHVKQDIAEGVSCSSPILNENYEKVRKYILELVNSCDNQYPLRVRNDEFGNALNALIFDYLLVYCDDSNVKSIENEEELKQITDSMKKNIDCITNIIQENKPKING